MASGTLKDKFRPMVFNGDVGDFILAAGDGDKDAVLAFLEKFEGYPDLINLEDVNKRTALGWSAYRGKRDVVELLLEKGADINKKNGAGRTALMIVAEFGNPGMAELLLDKGASPQETDGEGKTALDIARARRNGSQAMVDAIEGWVAENERQWLKRTDCSGGIDQPLRAPTPLKMKKGLSR